MSYYYYTLPKDSTNQIYCYKNGREWKVSKEEWVAKEQRELKVAGLSDFKFKVGDKVGMDYQFRGRDFVMGTIKERSVSHILEHANDLNSMKIYSKAYRIDIGGDPRMLPNIKEEELKIIKSYDIGYRLKAILFKLVPPMM